VSPKVEKLPGEPITIYTAPEDADLDNLPAANRMLTDILDRQSRPVYHIANMLAARPLDLDGLKKLASNALLGREALFRHPMIKEVIVVSRDPALVMIAEGLDASIHSLGIKSFRSLAEALEYARTQIVLSVK
jgi:hypothetical protein